MLTASAVSKNKQALFCSITSKYGLLGVRSALVVVPDCFVCFVGVFVMINQCFAMGVLC